MPKEKDAEKIPLIFKATLKVVLENGFKGLKMADVAKEASLSTGTLYNYFTNKEELIDELYLYVKLKIIEKITCDFDEKDTFFAFFKKFWTQHFMLCYQSPEKMMFVEQFCNSGFIKPETKEIVQQKLSFISNEMLKAQEQMIILNLPIPIISGQILGATSEIVKYHIQNNIQVTEVDIENYFSMAWNAIRK